jgi:hypothetical protein
VGHRRVAMATARPVWSLNHMLASRPGSWWSRLSVRMPLIALVSLTRHMVTRALP